jgi:hypothetical protein
VQVPPEQNLPVIRKALENAGNKNYEVDELPGLNHLFQTSKTGGIGLASILKLKKRSLPSPWKRWPAGY